MTTDGRGALRAQAPCYSAHSLGRSQPQVLNSPVLSPLAAERNANPPESAGDAAGHRGPRAYSSDSSPTIRRDGGGVDDRRPSGPMRRECQAHLCTYTQFYER